MDYWKKVILAQQQSGLKAREYCRQQDIKYNAFYYWLRKIREEFQHSKDTPRRIYLAPMDLRIASFMVQRGKSNLESSSAARLCNSLSMNVGLTASFLSFNVNSFFIPIHLQYSHTLSVLRCSEDGKHILACHLHPS